MSDDDSPFIWRYQEFYRNWICGRFDLTMQRLGKVLPRDFYLIGFSTRSGTRELPVFYPNARNHDPESLLAAYDQLVRTKGYVTLAEANASRDYGKLMVHRSEFLWSLRDTVVQQAGARFAALGKRVFGTVPYEVDGYIVLAILVASEKEFEQFAGLDENQPFSRSLLRSVIEQFLIASSFDIRGFDRSVAIFPTVDESSELIKRAASSFVAEILEIANRRATIRVPTLEFIDCCNAISQTPYERAEGKGTIVASDLNHADIDVSIRFVKPEYPTDVRRVRKLLEMCDGDLSLLMSHGHIYGLGRINSTYKVSKKNIFEFKFVKHYCWQLSHAGTSLMRVEYGEPRLPREKFDAEDFKRRLHCRFGEGNDKNSVNVSALVKLAAAASDAQHGAMIVISSKAKAEAARLAPQSFAIHEFGMTTQEMRAASRIDGAILLDPVATCHGIGIILDGQSDKPGNAARGARFNSALRYEDQHKDCVVLVVSEDGMVDPIGGESQSAAGNEAFGMSGSP